MTITLTINWSPKSTSVLYSRGSFSHILIFKTKKTVDCGFMAPPPMSTSVKIEPEGTKSTFTLTFAIEILDLEVWFDHKEGWADLGPCATGFRLQYQLYHGQTFDVDIAIWPHVAKVFCEEQSCWVRTWSFLERRWLTFSIRHAFPVRVKDLQKFQANVSVWAGLNSISPTARGEKPARIFFPPLEFGQRRYFVSAIEDIPTEREALKPVIRHWIWSCIADYIPPSPLDGEFDVPTPVTDIRHQDTILEQVQEIVLNRSFDTDLANLSNESTPVVQPVVPEKSSKKKEVKEVKEKYIIHLSGDTILAGCGRLVKFEKKGERPPEIGEVIIILGSSNLPAQDDIPIIFINVDRLFDPPLEEFRRLSITHLYTRWILGDEVHDSEHVSIKSRRVREVTFNDHHALLLEASQVTKTTATFLDDHYYIQLRGIRESSKNKDPPKLFGYDKSDFSNNLTSKFETPEELDFIIATTKIDGSTLAKGLNSFLRGEFSLYPPIPTLSPLPREGTCTNDINLIGADPTPKLVVPVSLVLGKQMILEVSMGVVGCKPPRLDSCFSRLYSLIRDSDSIMAILVKVRQINEKLAKQNVDDMLTGFALDTGDIVILYLEGPKDGLILEVWEMTEDFYPKVKPVFNTSARFSTRIYPELLQAIVPFIVLKSYVPLGLLLGCPYVYARPALPVPARIAVLKFGRLIQNRYRLLPPRCELPSAVELWSFRLELCSPPRTFPTLPEKALNTEANLPGSNVRINWEKTETKNT